MWSKRVASGGRADRKSAILLGFVSHDWTRVKERMDSEGRETERLKAEKETRWEGIHCRRHGSQPKGKEKRLPILDVLGFSKFLVTSWKIQRMKLSCQRMHFCSWIRDYGLLLRKMEEKKRRGEKGEKTWKHKTQTRWVDLSPVLWCFAHDKGEEKKRNKTDNALTGPKREERTEQERERKSYWQNTGAGKKERKKAKVRRRNKMQEKREEKKREGEGAGGESSTGECCQVKERQVMEERKTFDNKRGATVRCTKGKWKQAPSANIVGNQRQSSMSSSPAINMTLRAPTSSLRSDSGLQTITQSPHGDLQKSTPYERASVNSRDWPSSSASLALPFSAQHQWHLPLTNPHILSSDSQYMHLVWALFLMSLALEWMQYSLLAKNANVVSHLWLEVVRQYNKATFQEQDSCDSLVLLQVRDFIFCSPE